MNCFDEYKTVNKDFFNVSTNENVIDTQTRI